MGKGEKAPIPADRLEGTRWAAAHVGEDVETAERPRIPGGSA